MVKVVAMEFLSAYFINLFRLNQKQLWKKGGKGQIQGKGIFVSRELPIFVLVNPVKWQIFVYERVLYIV